MSNENNRVDEVQATLRTNEQQAAFYNKDVSKRETNIATELWRAARRPYYYLLSNAGIWTDIYALQSDWMGDMSDKKVLDLGCYSGNALSMKVARECRRYIGVDLSEPATAELQERIDREGLKNANAIPVDFLSSEFVETEFDLCYAQGVLHHFKHFDAMLETLASKLSPGGTVVSCDPLQTPVVGQIARALYRPFQLNKDWEWPFSKSSFDTIQKYFEIEEIQGFMGRTKRAFPMAFINKRWAVKYARKLHQVDMSKANQLNSDLWTCMQVIMKLRKK